MSGTNSVTEIVTQVAIQPLTCVDDVLSWDPSGQDHRFYIQPTARRYRPEGPKMLVCHDMKGGYQEDRFVHGFPSSKLFRLFHWSCVDIFVYFSHHLVTIPPRGWLIAAHRHGVRVLGTLITEWEEGVKSCNEILGNPETKVRFCNQLCRIAQHYGFDGWLLNIENKLEEEQVPILRDFIGMLTLEMHKVIPDSLVIWYDSVVATGQLKWQDELNDQNRQFFDVCDGIFLNYNWKNDQLTNSVVAANERVHEVYVGVDVFGRSKQKGGHETHKTMKSVIDSGMSVALFAPGWIYETEGKENFTSNQYRFWNGLCELLVPSVYTEMPFATSFCQGFGTKIYRHGKVISNREWFNLSLQQLQPTFHSMGSDDVFASIDIEDAYSGGGCLRLAGKIVHDMWLDCRLFSTRLRLEEHCIAVYTFKKLHPDAGDVYLSLCMEDEDRSHYDLLLVGEAVPSLTSLEKTLYPIPAAELPHFERLLSFPINRDENGWISRVFVIQGYHKEMIVGIGLRLSIGDPSHGNEFGVLLGQIQLLPLPNSALSEPSHVPRNPIQRVVCKEKYRNDENIFLYWVSDAPSPQTGWDVFCRSPVLGERYLGTTVEMFFAVNLQMEPLLADLRIPIEFSAHSV